ncbi:MAG TPA: deiodinase-like protein, partial [Tepidisphaeraceae bacterium]|nr:deiodinase-like protein [Tepidisphaeraceae bacterium]
AALEQLRREYDVRAQFVVVYAAEAHPEDGWQVERNRAEDVRVAQPPDAAARAAVAKQAKARLRLSWPVAVDAMDNATAGAYAAGGNAAFVINRDGTVAAVQQWCDPDGLRRHIDAATARAGK